MALPGGRSRAWRLKRRAADRDLAATGIVPAVLAQLLLNRGCTPQAARTFLELPDAPLCDPTAMAGVQPAVARLSRAVADGEPIGIFGDYDVDGLSGSAALWRTLRALGGRARVFIPDRVADGYGLSTAWVERFRAAGIGLLVTVDCGISARDEVALAHSAGLDVIVTDHHLVPAELPDAVAVLNPHQPGCGSAWKDLAGAGVALTLARALLDTAPGLAGRGALERQLVQLATLGTIADVMPLRGENRTLVAHGLAALRAAPLVGLREVIAAAGRELRDVDAETIAFVIAPRINAAGRMGSPLPALELLTTNDRHRAQELAAQLERLNFQRQQEVQSHLERARLLLEARGERRAHVLVGDFPLGVVGLLAARLAEETARPTAVLRLEDGVARGSLRGPLGVNLVESLGSSAALLTRFGGHARAAGLTLPAANLPAFEAAFEQAAATNGSASDPGQHLELDCILSARSLTSDLLPALALLEPCGAGNPAPLFLTRGFRVRSVQPFGQKHARLHLELEGRLFRVVAFRWAGRLPQPGEAADLAFHLRRDARGDDDSIELQLVDWRPGGPDPAPATYTQGK